MSTEHAARPMPPLPAPGASEEERGTAVCARWAARHGAPPIEAFRAVYQKAGLSWPGDDEVRRLHVVAPADEDASHTAA